MMLLLLLLGSNSFPTGSRSEYVCVRCVPSVVDLQ